MEEFDCFGFNSIDNFSSMSPSESEELLIEDGSRLW